LNPHRSRLVYANLLNLEYILGLGVAYLLGSGQWVMFVVLLVLTLFLGIYTNHLYWNLMDGVKKES